MCWNHGYAYAKWFYGLQHGVGVADDEWVTVFASKAEAEAYREWSLSQPND